MTAILQLLGTERLFVGERLTLARAALNRVASEQKPPSLSDANRRELDRRIADADANPGEGVPWEQVEAVALARFDR